MWPPGDNTVFRWQRNRSDCGLDGDVLIPPIRHCDQNRYQTNRHSKDDSDYNNNQGRLRARGLIGIRSNCIDVRGTSKDRHVQRGNGRGWYHKKPSQGRTRNFIAAANQGILQSDHNKFDQG
jgi:hypothetical protein